MRAVRCPTSSSRVRRTQGRLDQLKRNSRRLSDPASLSQTARERLLQNQPVFVSFSYNIHGNELASTEAALQVAYRPADVEAMQDTTDSPVGPYTSYVARDDSSGLDYVPGAALTGRLDATHPLTYGIGDAVYTLKYGVSGLEPSSELQTAGHYAKDAEDRLVSGYASQENLQQMAGKSFAGTVEMGEGQVVFLVDNTQYRMFWRSPSRMMQNAVMLVPGLMN